MTASQKHKNGLLHFLQEATTNAIQASKNNMATGARVK
jgi:hypothetical protein